MEATFARKQANSSSAAESPEVFGQRLARFGHLVEDTIKDLLIEARQSLARFGGERDKATTLSSSW
jgi:hypothetical protein